MRVWYEEKTFESYFNTELDRRAAIYFPFGQVQEGSMGADSSAYLQSRWLWWRLGYLFIFDVPYHGKNLRELAETMEEHLQVTIDGIPNIKVNLLFQYKRPELITSKLGLEWKHWGEEYFRYDIYQEQQELLEAMHTRCANSVLILYAAPALRNVDELVEAKRRGRIIESTNFRPAADLSGHHRNTYVGAGRHSIACSEPERMEAFDLLSALEGVELEQTQESPNRQLVIGLAETVRSAVTEDETLGGAFKSELRGYYEQGLQEFPLFFSFQTMRLLEELSGIKWGIAVDA